MNEGEEGGNDDADAEPSEMAIGDGKKRRACVPGVS